MTMEPNRQKYDFIRCKHLLVVSCGIPHYVIGHLGAPSGELWYSTLALWGNLASLVVSGGIAPHSVRQLSIPGGERRPCILAFEVFSSLYLMKLECSSNMISS